jgi:hypothetical protein
MDQILDRAASPARHLIDVDACYKMAAIGILTHENRVELIDGEIIDFKRDR